MLRRGLVPLLVVLCGLVVVTAQTPRLVFLTYDTNPGEGFNLCRDVYIRMASMVLYLQQLTPRDRFEWVLVLPPFPKLPHWDSTVTPRFSPWGAYFHVPFLQRVLPVMEYHQYIRLVDAHHSSVPTFPIFPQGNDTSTTWLDDWAGSPPDLDYWREIASMYAQGMDLPVVDWNIHMLPYPGGFQGSLRHSLEKVDCPIDKDHDKFREFRRHVSVDGQLSRFPGGACNTVTCMHVEGSAYLMAEHLATAVRTGDVLPITGEGIGDVDVVQVPPYLIALSRGERLLHPYPVSSPNLHHVYYQVFHSMVIATALRDIAQRFAIDHLHYTPASERRRFSSLMGPMNTRRVVLDGQLRDLEDGGESAMSEIPWGLVDREGLIAGGEPYLAVHLRRNDFVRVRKKETPTIRDAAQLIRHTAQEQHITTVFLASDCSADEFEMLSSLLAEDGIRILRFQTESSLFSGQVALIDQLLCIYAPYFVGTGGSTFTRRIQTERLLYGHSRDRSLRLVCARGVEGDDEWDGQSYPCEAGRVWPPLPEYWE